MGFTMSSLRAKAYVSLCVSSFLFSSQSFATSVSNDLLSNELWGLNNTPRSAETTPANVPVEQLNQTGTCAEKPDIAGAEYSCNSYTPAGITDMDINAIEGWNAYSPSPQLNNNDVVIALIDTGIDYTHPDLANKVWLNPGEATGIDSNANGIDDGCEDQVDGDNNGYLNDCHGISVIVPRVNPDNSLNPLAGDPLDDEVGHGTNMAGVIAAEGNNAGPLYHGGIVGVAGFEPRIKIATCKSAQFESDTFPLIPGIAVPLAKADAIEECMWYFYNLKQAGINIAVINASGGTSKHINLYGLMYPLIADPYLLNTTEIQFLAGLMESVDIPIVAASGNNSWSIDQVTEERAYFPASFTNNNIISVAASNNQGEFWSGSSYGRWSVDLVAPGQDILSTAPTYPLFPEESADFIVTHGSSQATAYVSGMIALLRANASTQSLDYMSIKRLLMSSGKPLPAAQHNTVSGSLARLADVNGKGALTCQNQVFRRRQSPQADNMIALPTEQLIIEVQNYNCADAGTEASIPVTVTPTNEVFNLFDDGLGDDALAGDGIYSGSWVVPYGEFEYTLSTGYDSVKNANDALVITATIIEDNIDNTDWVGKWWPSTYRSGYYGSGYRYATNNDPEKIFTWSPTINQSGYYKVFARWPSGPNFASNATYRVHHQSPIDETDLQSEVSVDQTGTGGQWVDMGSYWFSAGTKAIDLTNLNANGTVVADAIQLVPEP
jgi:serine protease